MSHFRKLTRTSSHRRALFRNQVTSLIKHERIMTTVPKAKEVRRFAENMITLGKKQDLASRRRAASFIMEPAAVTKLFNVLAPRFSKRVGGYTRIVRTKNRASDNADMCYISYLNAGGGKQDEKRKRPLGRQWTGDVPLVAGKKQAKK